LRLIVVGCEYTGKTTLAREIAQWWKDVTGLAIQIHDHFTFPQGGAQRHPPPGQSDMPEEDLERLRCLAPDSREIFQRQTIEYHLTPNFNEYEDLILVGFHIEEAVYAIPYYGYGYPRTYQDRERFTRKIDIVIAKHVPDTVLVLLKASPETVARRMKENQHYDNVIPEKDIEHILERFEEEYYKSWIRKKFTLDTTDKIPGETLMDFAELMKKYLTPLDTIRILRHQALKLTSTT